MAYYTGTVADYKQLLDILSARCVDHGWTWTNGILSKGKAFLKIFVSDASQSVSIDPGSGIVIQGGTGQAGESLINPSIQRGRLGRPGPINNYKAVTWPAIYHLHIAQNPDEVFLILNFDILYHYWLAFGVSDVAGLSGTGLWFHGFSAGYAGQYSYGGFSMSTTSGSIDSDSVTTSGFLCARTNYSADRSSLAIHTGLDGIDWYGYASAQSVGSFSAWESLAPLPEHSPSSWNQDAALLPIHGYVGRSEYKRSCALMVRNARYIRVDNYEVGDTITLGSDVWSVYPFYCKNASVRDGGNGVDHSGTFGWAIRR